MSTPSSPSIKQSSAPYADLDAPRLRRRLDDLLAADPGPDVLAGELQTAYEELQVADEEVRTQQETIGRLVESHRSLRLQQERTIAILPLPVLVTDMQGAIRSANAAAAMLTGARLGRLLGKPIFNLFEPDDRPALRRLLGPHRQTPGSPPVRRTARVVPFQGPPLAVEVVGSFQLAGSSDREMTWFLLSADGRSADTVEHLTDALTALALLPRRGSTLVAVLEAAADVCARAVGAEVSIALGSPLAPFAVASSSQLAQACDGAQVTSSQGPSVAAYDGAATVSSANLASDDRWPRLGGRLPDGVAGVAATPIESGQHLWGTLTSYFREEHGVAVEPLELLAVTLGATLHELELLEELDRLEADMDRALRSRSVIDQAKGIVMASRGLDADAAWEHLVHLSSTQHLKVRDLAERIVAGASGAG